LASNINFYLPRFSNEAHFGQPEQCLNLVSDGPAVHTPFFMYCRFKGYIMLFKKKFIDFFWSPIPNMPNETKHIPRIRRMNCISTEKNEIMLKLGICRPEILRTV
jgi:hypothetical protein